MKINRTKYPFISQILVDSLKLYVKEGIPPGGFLTAVLCNDLKEAIARADNRNIKILDEIVKFCYWEIPATCWGSEEKVKYWITKKKEAKQKDGTIS